MKKEYMVIAVWADDLQSFADSAETETPEEAVRLIEEQYTGDESENPGGVLIIAGVCTIVDGKIEVVL